MKKIKNLECDEQCVRDDRWVIELEDRSIEIIQSTGRRLK